MEIIKIEIIDFEIIKMKVTMKMMVHKDLVVRNHFYFEILQIKFQIEVDSMMNEEIEMVVVFKIIMIEKMVEIIHDAVDLVIVVVHEEVIKIYRLNDCLSMFFFSRSRWF